MGRGISPAARAFSLGLREQSMFGRGGMATAVCIIRPTLTKASFRRAGLIIQTPHSRAAPEIDCIAAEEEGFEPPVRCRTTVFKTAAIDHSAIPPNGGAKLNKYYRSAKNSCQSNDIIDSTASETLSAMERIRFLYLPRERRSSRNGYTGTSLQKKSLPRKTMGEA